MFNRTTIWAMYLDMFGDTKGVIRRRKLKDRQSRDQTTKQQSSKRAE